MKTSFPLVLFFVLVSCQVSSQENNDLLDLITLGPQFGSWQIKDSVTVYTGENLFSFINGGADIYLEYGFDRAATCKYSNNSGSDIRIEIYNMTSDTAAYGVFTINSSDKGIKTAIGNESRLYDYYLDFWKSSYFIRCTANRKEAGVMDTLRVFARYIDEKIAQNGQKPLLTEVFKLQSFDFKNIKYIRGIIGLGNVYQFGHGALAGFSEGAIGYDRELMLCVFSYSSDRNCREWFASAKGKMQMNQKFMNFVLKENGFSIKDKSGTDFCFATYKRYIIILKGIAWEPAQYVYEQIRQNLDKY